MDLEKQNRDRTLRFSAALLPDGWHNEVVIGVSDDGKITSLASGDLQTTVDESYNLVALPGMVNVHSHAFQRAFAGLSEFRTSADQDSFWTWRKLMYGFLSQLTPDDVYVTARQLFLEMLLAGYTWVGEFHYLHNDLDGQRYGNVSEMSQAIVRAAADTGIALKLLPVLYQRAGFDNSPLTGGQRRFELSNDQFVRLYEDASGFAQSNYSVGMALHSLRAVSVEAASEVITAVQSIDADCSIHIHAAEQTGEVDDCLHHHAARSIEFLFDHFDVDAKWCLIHATHLNNDELNAIASSQAVVGLCPTTEANLGDGFFPARDFLDAGGCISIGSDSHCAVDLRDELRTLEYGQRLQRRGRAILGSNERSVGRHLYQSTAAGGAKAIGVETGVLQVGARADLTLVDPDHPAIAGARGDALIDRMVFCNADDPIVGSMVGGRMYSMDTPEFQDLVFESQYQFLALSRRLMR